MKSRFTPSRVSINPHRLHQRQVEALYQLAPAAVLFSYMGALISLAVIYQSGDAEHGLYWFAFSTLVMLLRATVLWQYWQLPDATDNPRLWARLMVGVNFLAGVQWGLLGTVLFASPDVYRELFILMVIICYVAGSIVPFAPVKWAHLALAIPATLPPIIYIFFIHGGPQWLAGTMALFFIFTVMYFSFKQHRAVANRLSLELQNEELVEKLNSYNSDLGEQNDQLKHRTAVVKLAQLEQRRRVGILASHVERTLLPVIECDHCFNIVTWNEASGKLLGYGIDEVCGQNFGELFFPPERRSNLNAFVEKLFQENCATTIDMLLVTRSLQRVPVRFYVTPILADDHSPLRIAVIITENYTELQRGSHPGFANRVSKANF